jgi:hypothetical protein
LLETFSPRYKLGLLMAGETERLEMVIVIVPI